ncbi:MAG TPA: VCBS repeat-containing protein, partial [Candidatus Kapabacteria bacterium]
MSGGEWLDYRCTDSRLGIYRENHSPTPALKRQGRSLFSEKWSVRLGGSFQQIEQVPDASGDILMSDNGGIQRINSDGAFLWRTKPFGAHWISHIDDLDADGALEIVTSNGRELLLLSADTGEILFRDIVGPPFSYGTYAPMFKVHSFFGNGKQILIPCFTSKEVPIYDCSHGARNTRVLHKLWMDDGYHPSIVIGDVNNDGVDEIVIARLGGVYVFEPNEGRMISQTIWKSDAADDRSSAERRRNYGHFELADIDGDGNLEAIILSDKVTRHIAVLGNDGNGNFTPLWDRLIEHIYPNDTTELRYTSNSMRDFDGDGKLEIAVSIFNERKDGKWHTEILKAETGERIIDLQNQYLRGAQEVNREQMLFLSEETSRGLRERSNVSLYSPQDKRTVWELNDAHFAERADHPPSHYSEFKPDVFAAHEIWKGKFDGKEGVLIQTNDTLLMLSSDYSLTQTWSGPPSKDLFRVALFSKDTIYLSHSDGDVTKITPRNSAPFLSCGYHLTTEAHIAARPGSIPTLAEEKGVRYLLAPDFSGNIHPYTHGNDEPNKIKTIRGRSRLGYDGIYHAASVIETKNGKRIVIIDDEELAHSRLSLYSLEGECMRSYEFPDLPVSILGNRIGCYDWLYFQHSRGEALFTSFYQSFSMNSECSLAFLLETGEILWRINSIGEGDYGRGAGPWGTASRQPPPNPRLE